MTDGYVSKYEQTRPFGKPEGLPDRLDDWIRRLGTDRTLNFPGLGLIDDIRTAAALLRGQPAPDMGKPMTAEPEEWETQFQQREYDL